MSDDEYYGEYDDFEEGMWDADPAPDLADDLAEHAAYSPVWQDDPVGELEPYHSDWEYYSDDYYDDDPILKNTTLDGTAPAQTSKTNFKTSKRGKKRKLDEARDSQMTIEKGSLLDCIRGTVWAQKQEERHVMLQMGQQERIALLKNWKDMFKSDAGTSHTFGRGQLKRDESWANDLSLADMGLSNDKDKPGVLDAARLDEEPEENLNDEQGEEDPGMNDVELADGTEQLLETSEFDGHKLDGHEPDRAGAAVSFESAIGDPTDEDSLPRKRRKTAGLPSPPGSHESTSTATSEPSGKVLSAAIIEKKGIDRVGRTVGGTKQNSKERGTAEFVQESAAQSKKRRFLSTEEDSEASDEASNKRPTKRITPARFAKGHELIEDDTAGVGKATRSRLK